MSDTLDMTSPDLVTQNFEKLAELFPNCVTESAAGRAIDFDLLKQELSHQVIEGNKERYRLEWPGKREAIVTANLPTTKTLRPIREDSVDFDTTENLYIEGDNLEVLKLLQESYLGKIKMIYIDPPYNTGNDFIYKDNFTEDKTEHEKESGQRDDYGRRLVANPESSGRYHSDWLSMMYPRLKLARNLLTDDGVIFISIDDNEVHNLRKICDDTFGNVNFIGQLIWKSRQNKDNRNINGLSSDHEYILVYSRTNNIRIFKGTERKTEQYKNPDNDPRGKWVSGNMVGLLPEAERPNCHYDLLNPDTGITYEKPKMGWRYDQKTMSRLIEEKRILWPENNDGRPRRKVFLDDVSKERPNFTSIIGEGVYTRNGTQDINELFDDKYFDFPKPKELIKILISQTTEMSEKHIVLDFFAGSSTSADSVISINSTDGGNRRFIQVQLPEAIEEKSKPFSEGYRNICDIGKERIRRAAKKIKEETNADIDYGFRVFRLDESNMQDVYYKPQEYDQGQLDAFADNVKPDRTADDLLAQILLDWGLPLSLSIEQANVAGKKVFKVAGNSLYACFDTDIDEGFAKAVAAEAPVRIVFKDSGFKNDTAKENVKQLLKQLSPETEMKVV